MSQSILHSPPSQQEKKTQDEILRQIYDKLPHPNDITKESNEQTELLRSLLIQTSSSDSKFEFVWNAVLQSIAILFAVIFGTFSVLAYLVGETANKQSTEANQLSLLSLCLSNPDPNAKAACAGLYQQPSAPVASLANAVFGSSLPTATATATPTPTLTPTTPGLNPSTSASSLATSTSTSTTSTSSSPASGSGGSSGPSLNSAAIAGLTVGSVLFIASVVSSIVAFRQKYYKERSRSLSQV